MCPFIMRETNVTVKSGYSLDIGVSKFYNVSKCLLDYS